MSRAEIELPLDRAYYEEHHSEWVAALGKGWRLQRVMVPLFLSLGAAALAAGLLFGHLAVSVSGALLAVIAVAEGLRGRQSRARWLECSMALPWSGKPLRMEVKDAAFVRLSPLEGTVPFEIDRDGELICTPNGYLLRATIKGYESPNRAISSTRASLYVPHRLIRPQMSREEFLALFSK